tara:strand:+ start:15122 stop:16984 length:1863 start_codon:yes stop_codon:yes gene_type:complete
MAGQYKEAASIAQKMNLGEARSFIAENKRDLLKDLNYQGNKVTKYASEVSLNSAAKTYESTERSKRKKREKANLEEGKEFEYLDLDNTKEFQFYEFAHGSSLKSDLEFDKEGVQQEAFMKDKAAEVYKDPLKLVQGQKNQIKRRKAETYSYACTTPKTFELRVRRRYHYQPPPRVLKSNVVDFRNSAFAIKYHGFHLLSQFRGSGLSREQIITEVVKRYGYPFIIPVDVNTGEQLNINPKHIVSVDRGFVVDRTMDYIYQYKYESASVARMTRRNIKHYTYQTDKSDHEGWETVNPDTEEFTKKLNCSVKSRRCLDEVPREFDELTVKRPCWEDEVVYECDGEIDNTCREEDIKNCTLIKSEPIIHEVREPDTEPLSIITGYKRFYDCKKEIEETDLEIGGEVPFCLDGKCHQPNSRKDQDFQEVISKLNILKKMGEKQTGEPIHVFTGEPPHGRSCKVNIVNFKDCCQSRGWGQSLGLADCSPEEKNLAKLKQAGQCHYLGSYCSEKVLGFCIARKHSYCCFGSRLEREVQVQGSPQVGKGFGDAKNPDCRGFTVEELSKLDFDRINLAPLFEELVNTKIRSKDMTTAFSSSYKSHFAMAQPDLKNKFETRAENREGDL